MEYIRRCMLILSLALIAACSTIQAPEVHFNVSDMEHQLVQSVTESKPAEVTLNTVIQEQTRTSDEILAKIIAAQFKCTLQVALDAIKYATLYAHRDFPRKHDILAVIAVESRFNPNAISGGSKGVMQVLVKTHRDKISGKFDLKEQIRVGTLILRTNYEQTRNSNGAVMAYNVGLGAYERGSRPRAYLSKFSKQLIWMKAQERRVDLV